MTDFNSKNDSKTKRLFQNIKYQLIKRHYYSITGPLRALPDFIIIGAMKCGTTSLYYDICEHPNVFEANQDEIGFFDSNFHLGWNWYRSFFPLKSKILKSRKETGYGISGEDTPFYFWKEEAADRIKKYFPNIKLICIFRNPVDRTYSEYQNTVREGGETVDGKTLTFEESLEIELKRIKNAEKQSNIDYSKLIKERSGLLKGIYANQLKIWFDRFPKENILILDSINLKKFPKQTMSEVYKFLGLPDYEIKEIHAKKNAKYPKMNKETREKLIEFFKDHNKRFYELTKLKFNWDV